MIMDHPKINLEVENSHGNNATWIAIQQNNIEVNIYIYIYIYS